MKKVLVLALMMLMCLSSFCGKTHVMSWKYSRHKDVMTNHVSVDATLNSLNGNSFIYAYLNDDGNLIMLIIMNKSTDLIDYRYTGGDWAVASYRAKFGNSQCGSFEDSQLLSAEAGGSMCLNDVSDKIKTSKTFMIEVPLYDEADKICKFKCNSALNVSKLKK